MDEFVTTKTKPNEYFEGVSELKQSISYDPFSYWSAHSHKAHPRSALRRKSTDNIPSLFVPPSIHNVKDASLQLRKGLQAKWTVKQARIKEETAKQMQQDDAQGSGIRLDDLVKQEQELETVRKDRVFGVGSAIISEKEEEIIRKRTELKQAQLQEYEKRQLQQATRRICAVLDYITEEEAHESLKDHNNLEDEALYDLFDHRYIFEIRQKIAQRYMKEHNIPVYLGQTSHMPKDIYRRRRFAPRKSGQGKSQSSNYQRRRLLLNDALKDVVNMEGWSPARINAFKQIETNPNAYYYRFNAPGEEQRTGKWTEHEEQLFFNRMREMGVDGKWGIFSMTIPGRVGYQCSNQYRLMIQQRRITQHNYVMDEYGKLHYKFKSAAVGSKDDQQGIVEPQAMETWVSPPPPSINKSPRPPKKPKVKKERSEPQPRSRKGRNGKRKGKNAKKRARRSSDDEFESDFSSDSADFLYRPKATTKRTRALEKQNDDESGATSDLSPAMMMEGSEDEENPMPEYVDPITLDPVVRPAISPFGHVMGYESWIRTLQQEPKNRCPFTKQPITRRQLVVLTMENIEQYREKIVSL